MSTYSIYFIETIPINVNKNHNICLIETLQMGTQNIYFIGLICLFDLILYGPSTIFQLYKDESSWVEPVLS